MARKPQPNNIRALKGDPNKERYLPDGVEVEKLSEAPKPPTWLVAAAKKKFVEKADLLISHKLMTLMDVDSLAMLCALEIKMQKLWRADETPPMAMYTQYKSFASDFGFNVIAREKIKAPTKGKATNKFAK